MVDYSNIIENKTNSSGKKVVVIPLEEWENIQQDMKELEEYRAMKSGELEKKISKSFSSKSPDIREAIVEIEENVDYERILSEQNYQAITYEKFRTLADDIEWEHSLDEMLAALD